MAAARGGPRGPRPHLLSYGAAWSCLSEDPIMALRQQTQGHWRRGRLRIASKTLGRGDISGSRRGGMAAEATSPHDLRDPGWEEAVGRHRSSPEVRRPRLDISRPPPTTSLPAAQAAPAAIVPTKTSPRGNRSNPRHQQDGGKQKCTAGQPPSRESETTPSWIASWQPVGGRPPGLLKAAGSQGQVCSPRSHLPSSAWHSGMVPAEATPTGAATAAAAASAAASAAGEARGLLRRAPPGGAPTRNYQLEQDVLPQNTTAVYGDVGGRRRRHRPSADAIARADAPGIPPPTGGRGAPPPIPEAL